ncbi:hypothetical protein [Mycobacterium syngnathidarum]
MAALEDLEARVAALEADRFDYRAVLAAVHALGANQREHSLRLTSVEGRLVGVETRLNSLETRVTDGFRSVDEHFAEIKDLIIDRNGR